MLKIRFLRWMLQIDCIERATTAFELVTSDRLIGSATEMSPNTQTHIYICTQTHIYTRELKYKSGLSAWARLMTAEQGRI